MTIGVVCNSFHGGICKTSFTDRTLRLDSLVDFFSPFSYPKYSVDSLLDIQHNVSVLKIKIVHIGVSVLWDKIPRVNR